MIQKKLGTLTAEEIVNEEPEIVSELLDIWKHVEKTGAALEDQAKAILGAGIKVPNWFMKDGSVKKGIESDNVQEVVDVLLADNELGIKPAQLLALCKLSPTDITQLIAEKRDSSEASAKIEMTKLIGHLLTERQDSPSLKREK